MKTFIILCCSMLAAAFCIAQNPVISIDPESLEQVLYTGETSSQVIAVSNLGNGELSCTMTVEPTSPTGSVNNAVKFDGTNDNALVYNDETLQLTTQLTIEAWINFEVGGTGQPAIISKGRIAPSYEVFFDSTTQSRTISLSLDPVGTIVSQTVLSAGTWYHVAFTYDGAMMNLYINGILDKSQAGTGTINISTYNLYFAKRDNTTNHKYKGEMDDVRIWNIARSLNEIMLSMNHELSGTETGLVGYWKFNEESGNTAYDGSIYGNNANLISGAYRVPSGARIINWLYVSPFSMNVQPGASSMLNVSFNAIGLDGGTYDGQVIINSNDPLEPQLMVPVQLVVTPLAHINLSVSELEFGDIYVGATKTMSFIISNSGNDTLEVFSMTCPNADYEISPAGLFVPPGEGDTAEVTYVPSAPENDNAILTIQSNDLLFPVKTLSLSGTGIAPPVITVTPASVDTVLYSGKSATQSLTISNTGGSDLEWEITLENVGYPTVTFTKADYADWTNPANQDRITENVYITRANSQGIFNAHTESGYNYYISPDDTEWAYGYSVDLEPGDYTVWREAVSGNPPGMVNNPISLHLISEDIYFDVLFHSWTGGNSGGGFSYTRISVLPPWLQVSQTSGVLPPGASVELEVYFNASNLEGGDWDGIIAISNNDPLNPVVNVPAHLEVIDAPSILADQDTLDFGILYTGYDISKTLQLGITNTGSLDLLITDVSATPSAFTANPVFAGIDPGETEIFNVIFTPEEVGEYSGLLTLTNNDPVAGEYTIVLMGRFLDPPVIGVTPLSLDAVLYSGKSEIKSLTINNTGGSDLDFTISPGTSQAMELDGNGDYMDISTLNPILNTPVNQFTLECWVYFNDLYNNSQRIMQSLVCYNNYWLYIEITSDNSILFFLYDDNWNYHYIYSPPLQSDTWIHVACTYNGNTQKILINGIEEASINWNSTVTFNSGFTFGKAADYNGSYLDGFMDEIRIWNVARTTEEIQQGMSRELPGSTTGLVGYWQFDAVNGGIVDDKTGNNNDGMLYGNASLTNFGPPVISWLSCSPSFGTCSPGTSEHIQVIFDASFLPGGDYAIDIVVYSNDPAEPEVLIPATLQVIDAPSITADQGMLDFGEVFIGYNDTLELMVENTGSQDLLIFSAVTEPTEYSVFPPYAGLDPSETEIFTVIFSPHAVGSYPGTLTFNSNDPVFSEYIIFLEGICVEPPVISVSPDSLLVEILAGQTITKPFTIYNTGGSNLYFNITPGAGSQNFALEFDGSDDYINLGNNINIANSSFTLEAWAKEGSAYGSHYIWGQGTASWNYGLHAGFRENDVFTFDFYSNTLNTASSYTDTEWHHWACTFDAALKARKIYRDGIEVATDITSYNYQGSGQFYIGISPWMDSYFIGLIDDVRIWNVARTQEEIQQHMVHELVGSELGLIGYWNFDEGTGSSVYDKSPNGNHGTLTNGVTWTNASAPMAPAWLSVSQGTGTIPANSSLTVDAVFNATGLDEGDYFANITIASNDPVKPLVSIPVHMIVNSGVGISSVDSRQSSVVSFPNPFSDHTTFEYELVEDGMVNLLIFNHLGQEVAMLVNGQQEKGRHQVQWNAEGLSRGIYYFRLTTNDYRLTTVSGKLVVAR